MSPAAARREGGGGASGRGGAAGEARSGPVRVLLLATDLDLGGAERALVRLALGLRALHDARGLARYGVEAASVVPPGPLAAPLAEAGIPVRSLGLRTKALAPLAALRLAALLRAGRFDLLQTFLFHANLIGRLGAALAAPSGAIAVVSSVRIAERGRTLRLALDRLSARLCERETCVSASVLRFTRDVAQIPARKLALIPNGVPLGGEPPAPGPSGPWIAVGRLERQKGYDVLLEAWRRLASAAAGAAARAPPLWIVGAGPLDRALKRAASGLDVRFWGARRDVEALLRAASGFVLASRDEGLPNALLEAMAAARPAVATDVGGVREAVVPGETALVVPPEDPGALAEAVLALVRDPERARALGLAARRLVAERFSVEAMVARYDALYQEILAGRGGSTNWRNQSSSARSA